ncbi:MAG: hypothetical protein ABJA34_09230 [Pseudonocardiales bacterium]
MTEQSWAGSIRSRALAWSLAGVAGVGFAVLVVLNFRHVGVAKFSGNLLSGVLLVGTFVFLGTLLALRQPANPIGWLLTAGGLTWLSSEAALDYATFELAHGHATRAALIAAAYDSNIWPLGVLCGVGLPLLLFPAGRTRSPRWRWLLRVMVAAGVLLIVGATVLPGPLDNPVNSLTASLSNPLGIAPIGPALQVVLFGVTLPVFMLALLTAVVGVIVRFRTAAGLERQQLRWVLTGAVLAMCGGLSAYLGGTLVHVPADVLNVAVTIGLGCLPVSLAVAVLRYRLYDLDRIVSRTVSYAAVTGLLIAVYAGLVTAVSRLTPTSNSLGVAGSTLAVAALFQPLRRRVQNVVNRRFNRSRYDAARTVEAFTVRLREQVDLDALQGDLLGAVRQTVQPASATLWLRSPGSGA